MLSQSSMYAIRAVAHLSGENSEKWKLRRNVALALELPSSFLGKILGTLTAEGLLESSRGRSGGYRLARAADEITLREVVLPFDRQLESWPCLLRHDKCASDDPCIIHQRWLPVLEALTTFLTTTTVADLQGDPTEPLEGP